MMAGHVLEDNFKLSTVPCTPLKHAEVSRAWQTRRELRAISKLRLNKRCFVEGTREWSTAELRYGKIIKK